MSNLLMNETDQIKYVIKVHGQVVSIPFNTRHQAEMFIGNLPKDQQPLAEVTQVTTEGKELLFG